MNHPVQHTKLLIIGAGPFGLAVAAQARALALEHMVVGSSMSFWRDHMPRGMWLRSGADWHLDPTGAATLDAFLSSAAIAAEDASPLRLGTYLDYAQWFLQQQSISPLDLHIERLDYDPEARVYSAVTRDQTIEARAVVVAVGFGYFAFVPPELAASIPADVACHSRDAVDLEGYAGKRVLIIGGRQSAFETAALLAEAGAAGVDLVYRHDTPKFEPSDWSWVGSLVERFEHEPGWYSAMPEADRIAIGKRFWAEGRLKLEPWLPPRIDDPRIRLWPRNQVAGGGAVTTGGSEVRLNSGASIAFDRAIYATGYKPDLRRIPFIAAGNVERTIATRNAVPVLDANLQSSLPGLYFTSMLAVQDFGPFFAFTVSARTSARMIAGDIERRLATA